MGPAQTDFPAHLKLHRYFREEWQRYVKQKFPVFFLDPFIALGESHHRSKVAREQAASRTTLRGRIAKKRITLVHPNFIS